MEFDVRFSKKERWGFANYFAEDAEYSYHFAHEVSGGVKRVLLASVLTGKSYPCPVPDSSLRLPPVLAKDHVVNGMVFKEIRYDSVRALSRGSNIYMTYDNQKSYPCYLITYQQT